MGKVRQIFRNRSGSFALQFALMAVPLSVCTGLAIDGGRAFLARYELASALDAATLAAGSTLDEESDLEEVARLFVEKNFRTEHVGDISLELIPDAAEDALLLKGSVKINTIFMPLMGQNYIEVAAESEVRRGGNNVEVAMALDVTGSMSGSRIAGLKEAAKILIDEVVNTVQTPYFSKVSVAPWAANVNIGTNHVTDSALTDLRGALAGPSSISAAAWRNGGTTTKAINSAGWRTNSGRSISDVTWRNGASLSITGIVRTNSSSRIRIETSSDHNYVNGETVYITSATGEFTGLNGNRYKVADSGSGGSRFFWLQNVGTSTYTSPPAGSSNGTAGSSQRCFTTTCELRVSATSHGFADDDVIYIQNVSTSGGGTSPNNSWGTTYVISGVTSGTFMLNGTNGPSYADYSTGGLASECYVSDCRYRVTTTENHGFITSDRVFIWGAAETGGGTSINSAVNTSVVPQDPSGNVFFLPGNGNSYRTWTSGGSAAECVNSFCNVEITSNGHGLASGDWVWISGVGGLTGINTTGHNSWQVTALSASTLRLQGTAPSLANMQGAYSSGGTAQCLWYGCQRIRFVNTGNSPRVYPSTTCLVERYGPNAATDVAPSVTGLGIQYANGGSCGNNNYVTPLTSDKTRLKTSIDALVTSGGTAGQLGIAWSWYLLSPNFADVWNKEDENKPLPYDTPKLVKVAVLMTDGEFNSSTCRGVSIGELQSKTGCNTASSFLQAEAICEAMKDANITIYTVGLELNTALYSDDFLLGCATSSKHAYLASNVTELKAAFKQIASSISMLRISR